MKRIFLALLFFLVIFFPLKSWAQSQTQLDFFYSQDCPHCAKEEIFLDKLADKYAGQLIINRYEVAYNQANADLFFQKARELGLTIVAVPLTVIGDQYFLGYGGDMDTGAEIEAAIIKALPTKPQPPEQANQVVIPPSNNENTGENNENEIVTPPLTLERIVNILFLGEVNIYKFSLPILTIILGSLDGFNPCAMWVLIFLITLLLGMNNRRRMWVLGSIFIFTSALVYFLFMAAWLKAILFFGFIFWLRILIGFVALSVGGYNLKEYFKNKKMACKVTNQEKRRKIFDKLKEIISQKSFLLSLLGIIILSFSVNLVELLCSAGFPAVYTQVLALNNFQAWQYYAHIALYVLFFMLDDLLIFIIAMITLRITGLSTKYTRWSNLIGGILMLLLGLLLIFKPNWLAFA